MINAYNLNSVFFGMYNAIDAAKDLLGSFHTLFQSWITFLAYVNCIVLKSQET